MNQISLERKCQIVRCLVDGVSLRATARITDTARMTIEKLLRDLGAACRAYQDRALVDLKCQRVQIDEAWGFCYAKDKNLPAHLRGQSGFGSVWTFIGLDPDSKLIAGWRVGDRDTANATAFLVDLAGRLTSKVQLSADGHNMYLRAVEEAFGADVDFAQVHKIYSGLPDPGPESRYSPGNCCGIKKKRIEGNPDPKHISTSLVERVNLGVRTNNRRMTRLTNAFSKKVENLEHSMAIHFMNYNFVRIHGTIRTTPAMAAGVTDRLWEIEDVIGLLDSK